MGKGSFDCVAGSLRAPATPLRMTEYRSLQIYLHVEVVGQEGPGVGRFVDQLGD
jgi:hypothetical protein